MRIFQNAVLLALAGASTSAMATTYAATSANFKSIFYSVQGGDRIVLSGNFGALQLRDRKFATALNIDARGATFSDSLLIKNVSGLNFTNGTYGSTTGNTRYRQAIVVNGGSNINFTSAALLETATGWA